MGRSVAEAGAQAAGLIAQTLVQQSAILAYRDVFAYCAIASLCVVPVTLLLEGRKATAGAPKGH